MVNLGWGGGVCLPVLSLPSDTWNISLFFQSLGVFEWWHPTCRGLPTCMFKTSKIICFFHSQCPEWGNASHTSGFSHCPLISGGLPWWLRWQSVCLQGERPGFDPWVGKIPWRRKCQPTPVLFPGKSSGRRSLVGYSRWSCKESDMTEQLHFHFPCFRG